MGPSPSQECWRWVRLASDDFDFPLASLAREACLDWTLAAKPLSPRPEDEGKRRRKKSAREETKSLPERRKLEAHQFQGHWSTPFSPTRLRPRRLCDESQRLGVVGSRQAEEEETYDLAPAVVPSSGFFHRVRPRKSRV